MIKTISNLIIPLLVLYIILYGNKKKIDVYDSFIEGVVESFSMIKKLFPTFIAMILAVNLFINSGFMEFIFSILRPIFDSFKLPIDILPLAIVKPISGSASLAYLNNIFTKYGPDSFIGFLASVMQGSTDTTLYVLGLYFGSIGIKKIRYSLFAGLCADAIGIITSIIVVKIIFST